MTRQEKLDRIQKYRPWLYRKLLRDVPELVQNPDTASAKDVNLYNSYIELESVIECRKGTFKDRFSF